MTEEYILQRDVINDHNERMANLKKYYPYFKLMEYDFSQFQGGKYVGLDMGYLLMAVLRFFIEENSFKEKDVTYEEYSSFIKEIYGRDFGLVLDEAEERSLSSHIFEKIRNEGKPFLWTYFDPQERKKKTARVRLIESHLRNDMIFYSLTSDAVEFYLDTKEIRDESVISVSQVLLSKMIESKNFRGGMEVVRRINHQVVRLKMKREEVLTLLNSDVFEGVRAYEEFMEIGIRWFKEEQKMFHKNMELIQEALKRADKEGIYGQTVKDISDLEQELKKALVNHSDLLNDCTNLQIQADEMVMRAKFSKLKRHFDFQDALKVMMNQNHTEVLAHFIQPLLKIHVKKTFALTAVEQMLTLRPGREEIGEEVSTGQEEAVYLSADDREEQRIQQNYLLYLRILFRDIQKKGVFDLNEWCDSLTARLGNNILRNGDFYSFLIHLSQKEEYDMEQICKKPDTFLEEYMKMAVSGKEEEHTLRFRLEFPEEELKLSEYAAVRNMRFIKDETGGNTDDRWAG